MKAENRRRILQVILTLLTLLLIGWIFSNSLKTASESSSQSSKVRGWIQTFFDALFPDGGIEVSGHIIRKVAHFSEYALLGLMLYLTYRVYTAKKLWLWIPALIGLVVPFCDEGLQFFSEGRAPALTDVGIDVSGAAFGMLCGWGAVYVVCAIVRRRSRKRAEKNA